MTVFYILLRLWPNGIGSFVRSRPWISFYFVTDLVLQLTIRWLWHLLRVSRRYVLYRTLYLCRITRVKWFVSWISLLLWFILHIHIIYIIQGDTSCPNRIVKVCLVVIGYAHTISTSRWKILIGIIGWMLSLVLLHHDWYILVILEVWASWQEVLVMVNSWFISLVFNVLNL